MMSISDRELIDTCLFLYSSSISLFLFLFGPEKEESKKTLALMARQDHESNINVLLAHDESLEAVLDILSDDKKENFIRLKGNKDEFELFKNRKRKEKGEA